MAPPTLQTSVSAMSMASPMEKAADLSEQREIEAIWQEVYNKVIELAGGDPRRVQGTLDIESVLAYVDNVQASNKKKSEKFGTFKSIVSRTLQCINTVGGIVAEGASTVFAPAGMCYNALTFVIQAWQGYEGIFDNLAELLEKCTEFLERLESYQGRMDKRLARVAVQNLRLFVEICDRTIKLRRKHAKFLAFTKQLFLNDNGIQDLLGMMDRLNAKEALLVNAQTYKLVSDSAGDIKLMLDGQKEQKKEQEAKKWRTTIAKALGFPVASLDNDGEPIPTWQKTFDARKNLLVPETGQWIQDHEAFVKWSKSASPGNPVLVLGGKNGSGKTSLLANTLRYIRMANRAGPTSRTVAAYFFLDGEKKKSDDEDTSSVLEIVSRALLWQIATAYEAMTKAVYQSLEKSSEFEDSLDLWQQLFINSKERMNSGTTFFLFIDGFDNTLLPLLRKLASEASGKKTRIFLTARSQIISEVFEKEKEVNFSMIPISEHNSDDIDKYIIDRMDHMPILKDDTRPGISEWRDKILKTLRFKCDGDYFKLNTSLNALAKVDLVDDINIILDDADKTRVDQIDAELRQLNNIRTIKEIEEINEIIMWIETGRIWFSVDVMEALLSVKHRSNSAEQASAPIQPLTRRKTGTFNVDSMDQDAAPATTAISLLPFAQKLAEKYPIFTVTDSGVVDWRSPEIMNRIPSKASDQDDAFKETSTGPQIIQESEISIVKHFLNNVCPPDLYARFDFEQFFNAKLGARQKEYICLDPDNAEIKAAYVCLCILTDEGLRSNPSLRKYGMNWIYDHLHQVDLSAADRDLKSQVGPLLVKLFTEECGINSLFWPFDLNVSTQTWDLYENLDLRDTRAEWVYSTIGVQEVSRWLLDSSVTKRITDEEGAAFVSAVKASPADLHKVVLSHAAKVLADHLFRRVDFLPRQFRSACWFIRGYLSRLDKEKSSQMPSEPDPYREVDSAVLNEFEGPQFTLDEVKKIEAWAAEALQKTNDSPIEESNWEIHGALITFQLCPRDPDTIEFYQSRARKAFELNPQNWHAVHFLAKQPNTTNEEAVELLSRAKREIDAVSAENPEWIKDNNNSSLLARITLDLGDRLWDLNQDYKLAARTHRESLQYNYVRFKAYAEVLTRYQKNGEFSELIAFIETLNDTGHVWAAYFDELVNEFIDELTVVAESNTLAEAANHTNSWDVIETFFIMAIDIGTKRQAHDLLFLLRHGFAKTLAHAADGQQEDKIVEIQETALKDIKAHRSEYSSRYAIDEMTGALAEAYLRRAFQPNQSIEKTESYGSLIANLLPEPNDRIDIWDNNAAICCLIRYHHKRRTDSKLAKEWTQRIVRTSIELLSDEDEENDDPAYWLLTHLLTTVEDARNTQICWTVRNGLQYEALSKWQDWVAKSNEASSAILSPTKRDHSNSLDALIEAKAKGSEGGLAAQAPEKPVPFVWCDGCEKKWTVMDAPLYTCADGLDLIQLDEDCHAKLLRGELNVKGLNCAKDHVFIKIPAFDAETYKDMPRGYVMLPDSKVAERKWMPLEELKADLRKLYLDGEDDVAEVSVQAS